MKFLDNEFLKPENVKNNVFLIVGDNKSGHIGFLKEEKLFLYNDKKEKFTHISFESGIKILFETDIIASIENLSIVLEKYNKDYYALLKAFILSKRINYTGIFLNEISKNLLFDAFKSIIPSTWNISCHHMTICLGKCSKELLEPYQYGDKISLKAVSFSIDEDLGVMAVKVETDVFSKNELKHITIAFSPDSSPVKSNSLTNFVEIDQPLILTGFIGSINNNNDYYWEY